VSELKYVGGGCGKDRIASQFDVATGHRYGRQGAPGHRSVPLQDSHNRDSFESGGVAPLRATSPILWTWPPCLTARRYSFLPASNTAPRASLKSSRKSTPRCLGSWRIGFRAAVLWPSPPGASTPSSLLAPVAPRKRCPSRPGGVPTPHLAWPVNGLLQMPRSIMARPRLWCDSTIPLSSAMACWSISPKGIPQRARGRDHRPCKHYLAGRPDRPLHTGAGIGSDASHSNQYHRRGGTFRARWRHTSVNILCLDEHERLSPGQSAEITRVTKAYPGLVDGTFIVANLARWLA
jgi:hypothetical protein